jgi:glycogen debranching enzyme
MLPNVFPEAGHTPEYNTADATLWYFEAVQQYVAATNDLDLLRELYPVLSEIIDSHLRGTRYQIHADPQDGLLYAGQPACNSPATAPTSTSSAFFGQVDYFRLARHPPGIDGKR